jgi:hypothetical protein
MPNKNIVDKKGKGGAVSIMAYETLKVLMNLSNALIDTCQEYLSTIFFAFFDIS